MAPSDKEDFITRRSVKDEGLQINSCSLRSVQAIHGSDEDTRGNAMLDSGWGRMGDTRWRTRILGATEMPRLLGLEFARRVVRDAGTKLLMEDMWKTERTPQRLVQRAFKTARNIDVEVELADVNEDLRKLPWDQQSMSAEDATRYRAVIARLNVFSIDRPDVQYACTEASRRMSSPCNGDWIALKRITRYIMGTPRVVHLHEWQEAPTHMSIYVDSNWAGCVKTRKSTTGICIVHGNHLIRSLSKTQANIALSCAEAELYAMISAASGGLGAKAMVRDYGGDIGVNLYVDASAAIGVAQRKGLGRIRHPDTQSLWIQDAVRQRKVALNKSTARRIRRI